MDGRGIVFPLPVHRARRRTCHGEVTGKIAPGHNDVPNPQWKGATRRVQQNEHDEGTSTSDYSGGGAGRRRFADSVLVPTPARNSPNLQRTPSHNLSRSHSAQPGELPRLCDHPRRWQNSESTVAQSNRRKVAASFSLSS
jgi:hypothetical protein